MNFLFLLAVFSVSSFGQIPKLGDSSVMLKDVSKKVMDACKEDKSKIKKCESYTELPKLKVCLMENKEQLSEKCKSALQLVK